MLNCILRSCWRVTGLLLLAVFLLDTKTVEAATYYWTKWNTYNFDGTNYTLTGTITTGSGDSVTVTYTGTRELAGYQLLDGTGGKTDYYAGGTDGGSGTSPYTSPTVENRPDNVTIIRLLNAGTQTLTFSKKIERLAFAFVSFNANKFGFDRDFDILSFGDPSDGGNAAGFFGSGIPTKTFDSGSYPYVLSGTDEPHGTLYFPGLFNSLTWTNGYELWHGFTVGIAGTGSEGYTALRQMMFIIAILIVFILIGLIPASIAKGKGRSFGLWWFYGTPLFIVALPHALIMKANNSAIEEQDSQEV